MGTTFNVFSYDAVWAEHRTHHLPNAEQIRYVLCHGRGFRMIIEEVCEYNLQNKDYYTINGLVLVNVIIKNAQ